MPYSTAPSKGRAQKLVPDHDPDQSSFSPLIPRPSSRRTLSLSSSPSFSSSNSSLASFSLDENIANNSPFSPTTPLHTGQVPFSWEQIPGIPKTKQLSKKKCNDPSLNISLLPLPPAGNPVQKSKDVIPRTQKKHIATTSSFRKDPFFAALVECSKGNDGQGSIGNFWKSSRITRTLSDRLGLVSMYTNSCKTTCAVSKSMVYLPRSSHDIYHNNTRGSR
ncbi:Protease-associated RING/U-box zinc finger family protein [Heracleum sosnowskyi]|uniref:Protease-associated RING/U-box zinc finger family protein n=1 Tax=Heracleum sosnowskyi TaxID=360622 RepID=A0AAD8NBE8_9APIA|nr:Protease-associated RING/U-box zinc finger family protein [Heracleum sosnowskyi]